MAFKFTEANKTLFLYLSMAWVTLSYITGLFKMEQAWIGVLLVWLSLAILSFWD